MNTIEISVGDYKFAQGKNVVYTKGLEACVGIALFGNRREPHGLAHIYCGGAKQDFKLETEMAEERMIKFLREFEVKNPKAILVATPYELSNERKYYNPMLNFIRGYLEQKGMNIREIDDAQSMPGIGIVHSKDLILTPEEVRIIYKNRAGKWAFSDLRRIPLR